MHGRRALGQVATSRHPLPQRRHHGAASKRELSPAVRPELAQMRETKCSRRASRAGTGGGSKAPRPTGREGAQRPRPACFLNLVDSPGYGPLPSRRCKPDEQAPDALIGKTNSKMKWANTCRGGGSGGHTPTGHAHRVPPPPPPRGLARQQSAVGTKCRGGDLLAQTPTPAAPRNTLDRIYKTVCSEGSNAYLPRQTTAGPPTSGRG
jgi:hypothetical protein